MTEQNMTENGSIRFFMAMEEVPTATAQEKGYRVVEGLRTMGGKHRVITFEKPEAEAAKQKLTEALNEVRCKRPIVTDMNGVEILISKERPLFAKGVPLSLTVKWCFRNYRTADHAVTHTHGSYRVTKPDTDNLNKALKDCMTKLGFWADDAQVCEEHIGKYWSAQPGIWVEIRRLDV